MPSASSVNLHDRLCGENASLLVYGLGRSGKGVVNFLHKRGGTGHFCDAAPKPEDIAELAGKGFAFFDVDAADSLPFSAVVAGPGVPIDHPHLLRFAAAGLPVVGEVALAHAFHPDVKLLGVTGTAGKGGTTLLTTQLLQSAGVKALAGGNIDPPLVEVIGECDVAVIELSSFQLERVACTRFEVAAVTNLDADHIDRHGSREVYHTAKAHIKDGQRAEDALVLPADVAQSGAVGWALAQLPQARFCGEELALQCGEMVLPMHELSPAIHPSNAKTAILAAEAMLQKLKVAVPMAEWAEVLRHAQTQKGRFETVRHDGGWRWVEDSIATRTVAVKAALEQTRKLCPTGEIVWCVGGRDKGADLPELRRTAEAAGVGLVIGFGEEGARFAAELGRPHVLVSPTLGKNCMQEVVRLARRHTSNNAEGVVLLSPIGTSFDAFANYQERGAAFRAAVNE